MRMNRIVSNESLKSLGVGANDAKGKGKVCNAEKEQIVTGAPYPLPQIQSLPYPHCVTPKEGLFT